MNMAQITQIRYLSLSVRHCRHPRPNRKKLVPPPQKIIRRKMDDNVPSKQTFFKQMSIESQLQTNSWARAAFYGLDAELQDRDDIGLPLPDFSKHKPPTNNERLSRRSRRLNVEKRIMPENDLIPLNTVQKDWLKSHPGILQMVSLCDHYGIFRDLFGQHSLFHPIVPLDIVYEVTDLDEGLDGNDDDIVVMSRVHHGNILLPYETNKQPQVYFECDPDLTWTLVMTNPDGHLTDNDSEYVHWLVTNIRGGDVTTGDEVVPYLQPFPPRGTGRHRLVFTLYLQESPHLDLTHLVPSSPTHLPSRTFSTRHFYRDHQDKLTPAGVAFFQSEWDPTLTRFYQRELNMREPVYQYEEEPLYLTPQVVYPHRHPFNTYLDLYTDPKTLKKRVLLKRLSRVRPFHPDTPQWRYPGVFSLPPHYPSWYKEQVRKERFGDGIYKGLYDPFALDEQWNITHHSPHFENEETVRQRYAVRRIWTPQTESDTSERD